MHKNTCFYSPGSARKLGFSENSVHKGAGYIGWLAGEKFLSTEISKFVNVEFQKTSAKVANSKCEKNIREHHNELQAACVWILKPKK